MILVFGSLNVDLLVPVGRLPSPGETVLGGDYGLLPGGKGANQALAARRAGAMVAMAGAVGTDAFAEVALARLRDAGVDLDLVRRTARPTGCAAIMVGADGENLIAVASGANHDARAADIPDAVLRPQTLVLCQMEVPAEESWSLLRRAHQAGCRTMLNLAPATPLDPEVLGLLDILVANEGEAATLAAAPATVAARLGVGLIVTRGAAGVIAYRRDGSRLDTPALAINPVDTTGAGDTFTGVLAAGLDADLSLADAMRCGSAAAGLACLGPGAQNAMPDQAAISAAVLRLPRARPSLRRECAGIPRVPRGTGGA
ncbi:MAG: ribokinase [Alphaproteobacteria bacterium]|nr:ribokinase [Alphaproteobacteria bacterium]